MSAAQDGELNDGEQRLLDAHIAVCATCRAYAVDLEDLDRAVRISAAPDVPDLTTAILAAAGSPRAPRSLGALRLALLASAVVLVALAIPQLLAEPHHGSSYRHLAAFDLAVASGLVWTGLRPARALSGFLPIATVLVASCIGITIADGHGSLHLANHVVAATGLGASWLLELRPPVRPSRNLRLSA